MKDGVRLGGSDVGDRDKSLSVRRWRNDADGGRKEKRSVFPGWMEEK